MNNRIGFVRHGETYANIDNIWHGQTDTQLTKQGFSQGRQLGEYFHHYMVPDIIYASPLQRAKITAGFIADRFNVPVNIDDRLMEINLGDWEGKSFNSLESFTQSLELIINDPLFILPNGESQYIVKQRVVDFVEEINDRHRGKNIVVVAHGLTIAIVLSHYVDDSIVRWPHYSKDNTAFSELCLKNRSMICFNKTKHLD